MKDPNSRQPVRDGVARRLRALVLTGLRDGSLARGDRLPSARDMTRETGADPRVVLSAYRVLAREGLVELRPRSGIFVAASAAEGRVRPSPAISWVAEVLAESITRELPAPELGNWFFRATRTIRLRAVAIASTFDQIDGLARELRGDYGLDATGLAAEDARAAMERGEIPDAIRDADLVVTTEAHRAWVPQLAADAGRTAVVIDLRPDLPMEEWARLLATPVYVIAADPAFIELLLGFFGPHPAAANLRPLVAGRDDLSVIPPDAPVYITRSARARLQGTTIPGRRIPGTRVLAPASAQTLLEVIVRANFAADAATAAALAPPGDSAGVGELSSAPAKGTGDA